MSFHPSNLISVIIINLLFTFGGPCYAQENEVTLQTWYSFSLNKNISTNFLFYANPEYYVLVKGEDKWSEAALITGFEYYPNNSFDLYTDLYTSLTEQVSGLLTLEVRPRLGVRWHVVKPERKVPVFIQGLYEFRNQLDIDSSRWANSHRFRLRPELKVSLNRKNILEEKNIIIRAYSEFFMNTDNAIEERFWNRRQSGLGFYYRHNGRRRYELRYIQQDSKNNLEEEQFKISSHIVYLLVTFLI